MIREVRRLRWVVLGGPEAVIKEIPREGKAVVSGKGRFPVPHGGSHGLVIGETEKAVKAVRH